MLRSSETNKNFSTSLNELNEAAEAAAAKTNDLMSVCLNERDEMYRNRMQ